MTYLQARQLQAGMTVRGLIGRTKRHVRFHVLSVLVDDRVFPSVHQALSTLGHANALELGEATKAELLTIDLIANPRQIRRSYFLHEGRWHRGGDPLTLIQETPIWLTFEELLEASKIFAKGTIEEELQKQTRRRATELQEAQGALQRVQDDVREAERRLHLLQSEHRSLVQCVRAAQELSTVLLRKVEGEEHHGDD